jgi:hypothetical protein
MKVEELVKDTVKELKTYNISEDKIQQFEETFWKCYNNKNIPQSNVIDDEIDAMPEFAADAYVLAIKENDENVFWQELFGR